MSSTSTSSLAKAAFSSVVQVVRSLADDDLRLLGTLTVRR